ncbi:MAG: aminotransferase family protein [Acidimicrobiales bacterium]|jgi:4-aminobutyrate--pyruvate transaminase
MTTAPNDDERLPLLVGFQRVSDNTRRKTRLMEHGKGIYVYDTEGREYLEATASFYVASLGYQNDELIDAIAGQYRELPFFVSGMHRTGTGSLELAEKLRSLVAVPNAHMLYGSSGSEANDFLIKLLRFGAVARGEPNRTRIIGRHESYHGGTVASASLTGGHHEEFGLPIEGFHHVSQPDYHGDRLPHETGAEYAARCAAELEALLDSLPEGSVAAMFAEPISFSAGFKVPPGEYFPAICSVLERYGVELVIDEVITGMGRTGSMFGSETFSLSPHHLTLGKGVTSGYFPLSAIAVGEDLYLALDKGSEAVGTLAHASTFAAHPVGATAALKTIEIIERDGLVDHAAAMGERLERGLRAFEDHPLVGDIRSVGLAAGIDFLQRDEHDVPINDDADAVLELVYQAAYDEGLVMRPAGRSLVIAPPLIINSDEVDEIVRRVGVSLDRATAKRVG